MRSSDREVADGAWGEVYRRYHQRVWGRVFYVMRTIPWLREPREVATDVTTEVFVGLPKAVARYQDVGRAEQWLLRVALRTALRHKERLTGNWSGGGGGGAASRNGAGAGRSYLDLDDAVQRISLMMSEVELDERLELRRRLDAWRQDPAKEQWLRLIDLFLEGYSHDEIAERLGITAGTSRTWLWKIRLELGRPPEQHERRDEVSGRGAGEESIPFPHRAGAGPHLDDTAVRVLADAPPLADADAAAHLEGCPICMERVAVLRRGLAVLAFASQAPADLARRIEAARARGDRPLLPVEPADSGEPLYDEVVGRDAGDDPGAAEP